MIIRQSAGAGLIKNSLWLHLRRFNNTSKRHRWPSNNKPFWQSKSSVWRNRMSVRSETTHFNALSKLRMQWQLMTVSCLFCETIQTFRLKFKLYWTAKILVLILIFFSFANSRISFRARFKRKANNELSYPGNIDGWSRVQAQLMFL